MFPCRGYPEGALPSCPSRSGAMLYLLLLLRSFSGISMYLMVNTTIQIDLLCYSECILRFFCTGILPNIKQPFLGYSSASTIYDREAETGPATQTRKFFRCIVKNVCQSVLYYKLQKEKDLKNTIFFMDGDFVLNIYLMFQTNKFGFQKNILLDTVEASVLTLQCSLLSSLMKGKKDISVSRSCMKHLYFRI